MFDQLKSMFVFARVVESGTFRSAARSLNLSPSVVSYHISQLEKQLGVALFYRSTRKISLTSHGKILFQSASAMIAAAGQGIDAITRSESIQSGSLRITAPAALSRGLLIDDIANFALAHPGIDLNINLTDAREDLIAQGIDMAIRVGEMKSSGLKSRLITTIRRKLIASPDFLASKPKPKSPEDIASWEWIRFASITPAREFTDKKGNKVKIKFHSNISIDNVDALCQFAKAGLGLATPPLFLVKNEIEEGNLVEVLPQWQVQSLPVYGVWPANSAKNSLTNLFLKFLLSRQSK